MNFHQTGQDPGAGNLKDFLLSWEGILAQSAPIQLSDQQILFYQGHQACGVYLITSGQLLLVDENEKNHIDLVPLYFPLGFDQVIQNQCFEYTAKASGEVEGFFVPKSVIFQRKK